MGGGVQSVTSRPARSFDLVTAVLAEHNDEAFGTDVFAAPTEPGATMTRGPQALKADSLDGISKRKVTSASLLPSARQRGWARWRGGENEGMAGLVADAAGRAG